MNDKPLHFKGKDAIEHVAEAQAQGLISAAEIHGTEIPGHISAGADACRDTCVLFLLLVPILGSIYLRYEVLLGWGLIFLGWIVWRAGRAAWLGWTRLERLHRVLEQEKWEIEHNRPQEKDELRELYRAKGFDGKLLEDVLDVLMSDGDRLLRVMVEEELGLSLQNVEHPLKQGLGAAAGALASTLLILCALYIHPLLGFAVALLLIALSAGILAYFARNRLIPAIVWNVALALLAFGITYYSLQILIN